MEMASSIKRSKAVWTTLHATTVQTRQMMTVTCLTQRQECIDGASSDIDTDGDGVRDCEEVVPTTLQTTTTPWPPMLVSA